MPPLLDRAVKLTLVLLATFFLTNNSLAQIPSRTNSTATPVPGVGHDYIHAPVETVNPANGSLSIRIGVPMPPGRGLTLPFSFAYDSNGAFYAMGYTNAIVWNTTKAILSQGGWSYSAPTLSVQAVAYTGQDDLGNTVDCEQLVDFVMQDASGNRLNLGLSYGGTTSQWCNMGQMSGPITSASIGPFLAQTTSDCCLVNAVTVTDADGTTYSFPTQQSLPPTESCTNPCIPTTYVATGVSDRNGNGVGITSGGLHGGPTLQYQDSIGRTALNIPTFGSNPDSVTISGENNPYQVYWTTIQPNFPVTFTHLNDGSYTCSTSSSGGQPSVPSISQILLPNGQAFTFSYDPSYGLVTKITYPTGGYVRYVWGLNPQSELVTGTATPNGNTTGRCNYHYDTPAIAHRYVSFDGVNEVLQQDFTYSTSWGISGNPYDFWNQKQTTVTTHDLIRSIAYTTVYTYAPTGTDFQPNSGGYAPQIPVESNIQYFKDTNTNSSPLRMVNKTWANERMLTQQQTALDNGEVSETDWTYDPNGQEQVIEQDDYDYGSPAHGSVLRKTLTNYRNFGSNTHIVDRPQKVVISDSSKNLSESDYTYDSFGNMLSDTKKCFDINTGQACLEGDAITSYTYDGFGHAITKTDPGTAANPSGYTTLYSYADNFTDSSGANASAYLTQITYPQTNGVSHIEKFAYSYADGLLRQHVDENSHTTGYSYNDPLQRLTDTTFDGPELVNSSYNDVYPPTMTKTTYATPDPNIVSVTTYNGMGHATKSQLTSDPEGTDTTDTVYDGSGRVFSVSNPYRSSTGSTNGTTNYLYDALGRTIQVSPPDGTFPFSGTNCLTNNVCTLYSGNTTTAIDQAGNQKKSVTDALGRVTEVDEPGLSGAPATTASGSVVISGTENSTQVLVRAATTASGSSLLAGSVQWKNVSASGATTAGTTTVTVNGGEQQYPAGVIAGTGSVTIGGSEQAPAHTQIASSGSGSVTVNGTLQSKQVLVQAAASGTGGITINGSEQNALTGGTPSTGYATVSGYEGSNTICDDAGDRCWTIYDYGTITLTVNGYSYQASYDGNSAASDLASALASSISGDPGAPVWASVNGATVNLTSKAVGSSTNYPVSMSVASNDPSDFGTFGCCFGGSFSPTLTGGTDTYTYDSGTVYATVNGTQVQSSYGQGSTTSAIASDLAGKLTATGWVSASVSGNTISITSTTPGSGGNYSLSASSSGAFNPPSFSAAASGAALTGGRDASYNTIYDSGTTTIAVNGHADSYSWSGSGTTNASIASGLGSVINGDGGAPVSAGVSGSTVVLTARTTGASTNYSLSSSSSYDSADFSSASFGAGNSGGALTGGKDDIYVYDSGTATITVNNHSNTVNWGNGSSASSIASSLASAINADSGAAVTASAPGATVYLTAKIKGSISNYSLSASQTYNTSLFSQSSFSASASGPNLTGGWPNPNAIDSGNVTVSVNGHAYSASFGQSSTPGSIASALMSAINADSNVSAGISGSTVYLNPRNAGQTYGFSTSYNWDSGDFPNPSFTQSNSISDWGNASLAVNGHSNSVPWSSSATASNVAAALASQINGDSGAFVNATASGGTLSLTARQAGTAPNSYSASMAASFDTANFSQNQWSGSTSWTTTPGQNSVYNTVYDSGTVSLTVEGFQASAPYQQGSSASSIASTLASSFNGSTSSPVSASVSGSTLTLTAKQLGSSGNYQLSNPTSSTSQPSLFSQPSFGFQAPVTSALTGGSDATLSLSTPAVTLYQYDALGNLDCAVQKAQDTTAFTTCSSAPSTWRPRSFVYDSLSRLTSATNPESGTITYAYDASGNMVSKTSPAQNQPSASTTVTMSYCYDPLNRLTSKAYTQQACPQSSPAASYAYDSGNNAIGHRSGMTDGSGSTGWSYDAMGRVSGETHTINGVSKSVGFGYDPAGALTSITYPSGHVVNYTVRGAGRAISAIDPAGPSYVSAATYSPDGQVTGYQNGSNNLTVTDSYNKRLQPITLSAASPSQTVFSLTYDFHLGTVDNGNVYQIINNRDNNRTQNFSYDALNRIQQAWTSGPNWGETFTIDPWGNLTNRGPINGKQWYENFDDAPATPNNQLAGYGYDAAGNMTNNSFATFTYDAENRIASTGGWNYTYDGDGNRVQKASGSTGTLYWAGSSNDALAESNLSGTLQSEYVFFNGKRIARMDFPSGAVHYYFSDHLGSTSIVTDASGTIQNESDYYPYGGEIPYTTNDTNHYKFTGKERDSESNLDYFGARYFSSTMGRWMSPDWAAKPTEVPYAEFGDPQSLNLYGYVRNNPVSQADADGHCPDGICENISTLAPEQVDRQASNTGQALIGFFKGAVNFTTSITNSFITMGESTEGPIPQMQPSNEAQAVGMTVATGGLAATSLLVDAPAASTIQQNAARGAASESRVLNSIGETKNTQAVSASEGKSIPDFQNNKVVGEIKDAKTVTNTRQLRIQKEAAQRSLRQHQLITGDKTRVTDNAAKGTNLIRRKDLGPQ